VELRSSSVVLDVQMVNSFDEALAVRTFDALIVDHGLKGPKGNGVDLVETFRKRPRHRKTPAILVSDGNLDDATGPGYLLDAPAISKKRPAKLLECGLKMLREAARKHRTSQESRRKLGEAFADEMGLSAARKDVVVRLAQQETWRDISDGRGRSIATLRKQSKEILEILRGRGVTIVCDDLRATIDSELYEALFDAG
jgi:hypothetical protein